MVRRLKLDRTASQHPKQIETALKMCAKTRKYVGMQASATHVCTYVRIIQRHTVVIPTRTSDNRNEWHYGTYVCTKIAFLHLLVMKSFKKMRNDGAAKATLLYFIH